MFVSVTAKRIHGAVFSNHQSLRAFARFARLKPPVRAPREKPATSDDLINALDSQSSAEVGVSGRGRSKLSKGLAQGMKPVLDVQSRGVLEDAEEEILEHLMEAMESPELIGLFKGVKKISDQVRLEEITLNRDYSHITAWWTSPIIDGFAKFMKKKDPTNSEAETAKFEKSMSKSINEKLQSCEGLFRSRLVKKMRFKKVPRIYFRPITESEGYSSYLRNSNRDKQAFLREISNM